MPSLAGHLLAYLDEHPGCRAPDKAFDEIPAFQWEIYFADLAPLCPSRIEGERRGLQRNALRVELLPSGDPRCAKQSPDGRGRAWLWSGGSPTAYGPCCLTGCPRAGQTGRGT